MIRCTNVRIKLAKVFIYEPIENIVFNKTKEIIARKEKIALITTFLKNMLKQSKDSPLTFKHYRF